MPDGRLIAEPYDGDRNAQRGRALELIRKHLGAHPEDSQLRAPVHQGPCEDCLKAASEKPWVNSRAEIVRTGGIILSLIFQALIVAKVVIGL